MTSPFGKSVAFPPRVDASGSPDETLARARAAIDT